MSPPITEINAPLRILFDHMFEGIQIIDFNYRYLYLNGVAAAHGRMMPEELVGRSMSEAYPGIENTEMYALLSLCLRDRMPRKLTNLFTYPSGEQAWFDLRMNPVPMGVLILSVDISEQKATEQQLRDSREELSITVESMADGLITVDLEQCVTRMNPAAEDLTGWSEAEARGRPLNDLVGFVNYQTGERVEHAVHRVLREGAKIGLANDTLLIGRDGSQTPIASSGAPMRDASGAIRGVVLVLKSMKEQYRLAAMLQRTEARFQALVENSSDIVTLLDADALIRYESPAAERVLGYTTEERVGTRADDVMAPQDQPLFEKLFAELLREPDSVRGGEARLRRKDGTWCTVHALAKNLLQHPAVGAVVMNMRDVSAQKRAEQEAAEQLERLRALRAIDLTITATLDVRTSLSVVLEHLLARLSADAASVLLLEPEAAALEFAAGRGFRTNGIERTRTRLDDFAFGTVLSHRRTVVLSDLSEAHDFLKNRGIEGEGFVAYVGVPLVAKGQVRGLLEVFHRNPATPDADWLGFLEALAGQAAIAVDNARLFEELQLTNEQLVLAYDRTLEGWVRALDLRDKETEGHSRRVTETSVTLARALGLSRPQLVDLRRGALLHDVGKLGVPDNILLKPGPLTDQEWQIMRLHPVYAHEWLSPIQFLRSALDIPYAHHERWDGSGYPGGLRGEEIPLAARIFAVVDVWDALRFNRPYREAWPDARVRDYLKQKAGVLFDPAIVRLFLELDCALEKGTP